ncbi:MAG: hypothetical protein H6686_08555 [Fibrobacteria bacterium]|nr:hypothetical protein [Fibrobacteria bacterium]
MKSRVKSRRYGATILEALIAVMLLTMIIPALVVMSSSSGKVQRSSLMMENAIATGQAVLDSLSLMPAFLLPQGSSVSRVSEVGGRTYTTVWWYTPAGTRYGTIQAEVSWEQSGKNHSIRLSGGAR